MHAKIACSTSTTTTSKWNEKQRLNFIGIKNYFIFQIWFYRFIWLCLVLGTISALFFIVGFNIERFLGYPISSRVTLKYTENLTFPAVTICNYNQWRKSVVQAENSDFVNKYFFPAFDRNDSFNVGDYNVTDINITAEVLRGAHQKENMIVSCTWRSVEPCSYLNFTQVITDFGVCYTFNNPSDLSNSLTVRQTGYEHGLFLRLNLEQWDYFYGERKGAGFKVLFPPFLSSLNCNLQWNLKNKKKTNFKICFLHKLWWKIS